MPKVKSINTKKILSEDSTRYKQPNCESGKCFYHYEKVIEATDGALGAWLFIYAIPAGNESAQVEIENIRVEKLWEPKILFMKKGFPEKVTTPDLSFKKINPTKFEINVKGAHSPYTLVFTDTFNKNWNVYYDNCLIANDRHYRINGYANGWKIYPKDVFDNQEYTLILEYSPQKYFYLALGLSVLITFVGFVYIFYSMGVTHIHGKKSK